MVEKYPNFQIPSWFKKVIQYCFPYDPAEMDYAKGITIKNKFISDKIPFLYKYMGVKSRESDDLRGDISEILLGNLPLKCPIHFNDPFDYYPFLPNPQGLNDAIYNRTQALLDSNHERLSTMKYAMRVNYEQIQIIIQDVMHLVRDGAAVTCFTTDHSNVLMWGHYGDCHKGVCIKYKIQGDYLISQLYPVIYTKNRFNLNKYFIEPFSRFLEHAFFQGSDQPPIEFDVFKKTCNIYVGILIGLIKSAHWKYEDEWRLIHSTLEGITPADFQLPIDTIYLGAKIPKLHEEAIVDLVNGTGIKVFKMELSHDSYALSPKQII